MIIQVLDDRYKGWKFIPIAITAIIAMIPTIDATNIGALRRYTRKPNAIATTINNKEIIATEAGVADLDRIFGARSGGININMQGPTHNVYDNHVENQLNQQQNVYSNNENVMKSLEPKTVSSMTKMAEAAGVWGQIGVP